MRVLKGREMRDRAGITIHGTAAGVVIVIDPGRLVHVDTTGEPLGFSPGTGSNKGDFKAGADLSRIVGAGDDGGGECKNTSFCP